MPANYINVYLLIAAASFLVKIINSQCNGTPKDIAVGYKPGVLKYPESGEYNTSMVCEWILTSNVSGTILYKSSDIEIDCSDSYNIYDGESASSPAKETGICTIGSASISKPLDRSSGQYLFLRFISDGDATQGRDKGFTIHFVSSPDLSSCPSSGTSTSVNATDVLQAFTSPLFPNTYPVNYRCTWTISPSTPDATVTLSLYYIDIESTGSTCFDKLTINYGTNTDEVCGNENFSPTNIYTNEDSGDITITFTSDDLQVESGFVAVYVERETTTITAVETTETTTITAVETTETTTITAVETTGNTTLSSFSGRELDLTDGQKVAITIGALVFVVVVCGTAYFLYKYKTKNDDLSPSSKDTNEGCKFFGCFRIESALDNKTGPESSTADNNIITSVLSPIRGQDANGTGPQSHTFPTK